MLAVRLGSRRRFRRAFLLSLRLGRRHYLSALSAVVLGVALAVALTNSSLEVQGGRRAADSAPGVAGSAALSATPVPAAATPAADDLPVLFYYMLGSDKQRFEIEAAVQSDMRDWTRRGVPVTGSAVREFIVVTNPQEEVEAFQYLNDLFQLSQSEGFGFYFFDLR